MILEKPVISMLFRFVTSVTECVDWCSLSCHKVIKYFFLNLIKSYIYQASFLYFGEERWLCSHEITQKHQPSLCDALINVQLTNIYGRGGNGCLYIYMRIFVLLYHVNK